MENGEDRPSILAAGTDARENVKGIRVEADAKAAFQNILCWMANFVMAGGLTRSAKASVGSGACPRASRRRSRRRSRSCAVLRRGGRWPCGVADTALTQKNRYHTTSWKPLPPSWTPAAPPQASCRPEQTPVKASRVPVNILHGNDTNDGIISPHGFRDDALQ